MPPTAQLAVAIALGYGLGSIPFAWLIVRCGFGLDLRTLGSRNVGATNAARVAGQGRRAVALAVFLSVFVLDAGKGLAAVWAAGRVAPAAPHAPVLVGLVTILGHAFPVWLGFRGGKSVATSMGVFGWLAPVPTAVAVGVFAGLVALVRIVSVGSLAAALALPIAHIAHDQAGALGTGWPLTALVCGAAAFVIIKHRGNIARLIARTEGRIGDPPEPEERPAP